MRELVTPGCGSSGGGGGGNVSVALSRKARNQPMKIPTAFRQSARSLSVI
jgi:hypothetical protein